MRSVQIGDQQQLPCDLIGTREEPGFYSQHRDLVLSMARSPGMVLFIMVAPYLHFGKAALATL